MLTFIIGMLTGALLLMLYAIWQVNKDKAVQVQPKRLAAPYNEVI